MFQFSNYILLYLPENVLTRYVLFELCGGRCFVGGGGLPVSIQIKRNLL